MIRRLKNNKRGSALLYVMIVVLILVMVVAMILVSTTNANRQSAFTRDYEQLYYAAEASAQMAVEIFLEDLKTADTAFSMLKSLDRAALQIDKDALEASFKDGLQNAMRGVYQNAVAKVNEMEFNGQKPNLTVEGLKILPDSINVGINEWTLSIVEEEGVTISIEILLAAYLKEVEFTIQGTAGDVTTRTAEIGYKITGGTMAASGETTTDTVTDSETVIDRTLGGLNVQGQQFVTSTHASYAKLQEQFGILLENASTTGLDIKARVSNMDYSGPEGATIGGGTLNASALGGSAIRVKSTGNLTIGGALSPTGEAGRGTYTGTGRNNSIEYLYVEGNLTINGQVYMPNLKEVYVTGNVTISGGGRIFAGNGGRSDVAGTAMIVGTNVAVGGSLQIDAGINIIHDCRFYIGSKINITGSNGGKLLGNSVYIAYSPSGDIFINRPNGGAGTNNYDVGSDTFAPQFYAGRNISIYMQGATAVYGLLAAMGNIDRSGPSNNDIDGFALVGNGVWTGSNPFGLLNKQIDNLMDYGLIFNTTTTITSVTRLEDVVFSFDVEATSGIREVDTP